MKANLQTTVIDPKAALEWSIPDGLWQRIEPFLPDHQTSHPLGCHRKRVDNRTAMSGILFVFCNHCNWNDLNATNICSSSSAHRRYLEWEKAGVFEKLIQEGLQDWLQETNTSHLPMDELKTNISYGKGKSDGAKYRSRRKRDQVKSID